MLRAPQWNTFDFSIKPHLGGGIIVSPSSCGLIFLIKYKEAQRLRSLRITRPLTLFPELNDTAFYGSQRPLTLLAELNDTAFYGSQRPLTLLAELNDTALYGSQRQVLGPLR